LLSLLTFGHADYGPFQVFDVKASLKAFDLDALRAFD